jgi:hypothetical protein
MCDQSRLLHSTADKERSESYPFLVSRRQLLLTDLEKRRILVGTFAPISLELQRKRPNN